MRITLIALGLVSLSCSSEKGLTVYNQAPSVTIFDPFDDEVFDEGEVVGFSARIGDDQDPVDSLVRVWRSDRHDLGGAELSLSADGIATMTTGVLGLGAHTISLTVIDSDGQETTDSVGITLATPSMMLMPMPTPTPTPMPTRMQTEATRWWTRMVMALPRRWTAMIWTARCTRVRKSSRTTGLIRTATGKT